MGPQTSPWFLGNPLFEHRPSNDLTLKRFLIGYPATVFGARMVLNIGSLHGTLLPKDPSQSNMFSQMSIGMALSLKEIRTMFSGGLSGLFPGCSTALIVRHLDRLTRDLIAGLFADPIEVAEAQAKRKRVLSLIRRKISRFEHNPSSPEYRTLVRLHRSLKPFTPIQLSIRYLLISYLCSISAVTLTYPFRSATLRLIAGEASTEVFKCFKSRIGFRTLWKGFFWYIIGVLITTSIQHLASASINSMYNSIDEAINEANTTFATSCRGKPPLSLTRMLKDNLVHAQCYIVLNTLLSAPCLSASMYKSLSIEFPGPFPLFLCKSLSLYLITKMIDN